MPATAGNHTSCSFTTACPGRWPLPALTNTGHARLLPPPAVSEILLNGKLVGRTVNAHRPHAFDVSRLLAPGRNLLAVTLFSAPKYTLAQQEAYPYPVPENGVGLSWRACSGVRVALV